MNSFLPILYILGLFLPFAAGSILIRNHASFLPPTNREFSFPQTTFLLLLVIGIPSVLQFFVPTILSTFQRDYERFLYGEWWRLISPLFVQDGGIIGTVFNLMSLVLVGSVAERIWHGRSMLIIFFLGGIVGEIAGFAWQPIGAGNSIGNFSLAASIAIVSLSRMSPRPAQFLSILALSADGILLWLHDIHGAAALAGAILALFLSRTWHDKKSE